MQDAGIGEYLKNTGFNLVFAGVAFLLWRFVKRYTKVRNYILLALTGAAVYALLFVSFSVAIYFFWMLGIAVIGLFMRPAIGPLLERMVQWALCMAALLLGVLLAGGVTVFAGISLGLLAYSSQILVGCILCRRLPAKDRLHIALAQQNGITAIILALLFETYYPGTVAIVGPAILVVNTLHFAVNYATDVWVLREVPVLSWQQRAKQLRAHLTKM
jgi:hypothetical protein